MTDDLILIVMTFLSRPQLFRVGLACRRLLEIAEDRWKDLCSEHCPMMIEARPYLSDDEAWRSLYMRTLHCSYKQRHQQKRINEVVCSHAYDQGTVSFVDKRNKFAEQNKIEDLKFKYENFRIAFSVFDEMFRHLFSACIPLHEQNDAETPKAIVAHLWHSKDNPDTTSCSYWLPHGEQEHDIWFSTYLINTKNGRIAQLGELYTTECGINFGDWVGDSNVQAKSPVVLEIHYDEHKKDGTVSLCNFCFYLHDVVDAQFTSLEVEEIIFAVTDEEDLFE